MVGVWDEWDGGAGNKGVRMQVIMVLVMTRNTDIHAFSKNFGDPKLLALPSTLSLMPNLLPTTLISSPHMPTLPPLAHHYLALEIGRCFALEQQLRHFVLPLLGCHHERCETAKLHT